MPNDKSASTPDFSKAAFALPPEIAFFNTAQCGPLHNTVRAAGEAALLRKQTPWRVEPRNYFGELETARRLFGGLVGAPQDAIAVVPSVSYAMAAAAANLPLGAGRVLLTSAGQFPSNQLIWERKAREAGASLVAVAPEEMVEAVDERVAIVACDPLRWSDGARLDLAAIAARARAVGAALALDLTQAAGAEPVDLAALDPDFAAAPGYKWLLGPYTQGFLYVAERRWEGRPLEESAGARDPGGGYLPGARRFDMGEKAHYHLTPMTIAGLELVTALDPSRLTRRLAAITDRLAALFDDRGFQTTAAAARSPHIFAATPPAGREAQAWREALAAEGVHVSVRAGALRVSPHLWVDEEDEARLAAALRRL